MKNHANISRFVRVLCGILSLYFLNISIDVANTLYGSIPENPAYNKQESIVEIVVEKIFGFDDAIAEYDEQDTDQNMHSKKNFSLDYFTIPTITVALQQHNTIAAKAKLLHYSRAPLSAHREIHSPPPDSIV